jgi:hypothetical protein
MTDKKFTERLKCFFTNEEKQELGFQMAESVSRRIEHCKSLKAVTAQIKSDIAKEDSIISSCSGKIREGYEFRQVTCQDFKDFEQGIVRTFRLDTSQIIRERKMEPEEMQKDLFKEDEVTDVAVIEDHGGNGGDQPDQPVEVMQEV